MPADNRCPRSLILAWVFCSVMVCTPALSVVLAQQPEPSTEAEPGGIMDQGSPDHGGAPAEDEDLDRVYLLNGDFLTGDIKKLERGQLRFKSDATDTIYIDWETVARLTSTDHYQVEMQTGERFFGTLGAAPEDGTLRIMGFDAALQIRLERVVRITPIEDGFFQRLDGSLSLGYSFTKSSDVTQFNFSGDASYRERKFLAGVSVSSIITSQESGTTDRETATLTYQRFYRNRWFTDWSGSGEKNEELGFDLRLLASGAAGRHLIQTNHNLLDVQFGLALNREYLVDDTPVENTVELVLGASYDVFRARSPELDLSTSLRVYPSLTESGRVRSEFNLRFRWEMVKDFFWQMDYYDSRDNKPSTEDASNNDYGISTSLGWSF